MYIDKKTVQYYSHVRPEMAKFVPPSAKRILDVGCGKGFFSTQFKDKMETWGIEMDPEIAKVAQKNLHKVITGDVLEKLNELPDLYFDCIIFNDVLEHTLDPYSILKKIKNKLSDNGIIICSIPNIRHISVLRMLLIKKQWKYENFGIMDKTHFRFFTRKSLIEMFKDSGYEIQKIEGINGTSWWKFFPINILALGSLSDSRYIQFACVAKPRK
jgi:2-polyprenyl-3-methyl-5-hydroxy-6-metoxy-1,4-benzoquinol methylase